MRRGAGAFRAAGRQRPHPLAHPPSVCPAPPPVLTPQGHRLKNMNCKLIRELKTLRTENKLLLTGTPLQVCGLRLRRGAAC